MGSFTSMKAYLLESNLEDYQGLVPCEDSRVVDELQRFNTTPIGDSWVPLNVEINDDDPQKLPPSDFPYFMSHIPVFSDRAVKALGDVLNENGELLTLSCAFLDCFAYNVTSTIDALNVEASDIVYFPSGKFMHIRRYALYQERIKGPIIFKLPQAPLMGVFVTDAFVQLVQQTNLTGYLFRSID